MTNPLVVPPYAAGSVTLTDVKPTLKPRIANEPNRPCHGKDRRDAGDGRIRLRQKHHQRSGGRWIDPRRDRRRRLERYVEGQFVERQERAGEDIDVYRECFAAS